MTKAKGGGEVLILVYRVQSTAESQDRNSGRDHGGILLTSLLVLVQPAFF